MLGEIGISVSNLGYTYPDGTRALNDVSFEITQTAGKVVGVLGPNGAGKTTLINILTGEFKAFDGDVRVSALNLKGETDKIKKIISFAGQNVIVDILLTVEENLSIPGLLLGIPQKILNDEIDSLLHQFALYEHRKKLALHLSGGQTRRLQICRALLKKDASLFFIDEPTIELDPIGKKTVWEAIKKLRSNNKLVFIATNDMSDAEELCDDIIFINKGKALFSGQLSDLKKSFRPEGKIRFKIDSPAQRIDDFLKNLGQFEESEGAYIIYSTNIHEALIRLINIASGNDIELKEIDLHMPNLETIFHTIVKSDE